MVILKFSFSKYYEYSIKSQTFIILDPDFPRLVLEVIQKLCTLGKNAFSRGVKGSFQDPKKTKVLGRHFYQAMMGSRKTPRDKAPI